VPSSRDASRLLVPLAGVRPPALAAAGVAPHAKGDAAPKPAGVAGVAAALAAGLPPPIGVRPAEPGVAAAAAAAAGPRLRGAAAWVRGGEGAAGRRGFVGLAGVQLRLHAATSAHPIPTTLPRTLPLPAPPLRLRLPPAPPPPPSPSLAPPSDSAPLEAPSSSRSSISSSSLLASAAAASVSRVRQV
jgi:hypothetical protein